MSTYSIKDLENLTGIKAHTIRIWEQRYGVIQPSRNDGNIRAYNADDLKTMLNITLLNNNGYKISKIADMTKEEIKEKVLTLLGEPHNYEDQINGLTLAMIEMDEARFEKLIAASIMHAGFEECVINIIFPFMFRIGTLWQTNTINPAQEHFMSNLIRQKLIVAIDGIIAPSLANNKKFVLFLPEGEMHEVSLLFASYIIKSRGHKVVYLGQSLPLEDLEEVMRIHRPDYIFSVFTSYPAFHEVQSFVDTLGQKFPQCHILLTGHQILGQGINLHKNMALVPHFNTLIQLLKEIGRAA